MITIIQDQCDLALSTDWMKDHQVLVHAETGAFKGFVPFWMILLEIVASAGNLISGVRISLILYKRTVGLINLWSEELIQP